ncbi:MAG: NIL domain-containing protein [Pseudomonadota bacterium]
MYSRILTIRFPKTAAHKPMICHIVKQFDLDFNIFQATIYPRQEGMMVMELSGHRQNFKKGIDYLKAMGVKVENVGQDVRRNDDICYQCGLCTSVCPTGALSLKRPEMEVVFDPGKCTGCEICVPVCPPRAMQVTFDRQLALE